MISFYLSVVARGLNIVKFSPAAGEMRGGRGVPPPKKNTTCRTDDMLWWTDRRALLHEFRENCFYAHNKHGKNIPKWWQLFITLKFFFYSQFRHVLITNFFQQFVIIKWLNTAVNLKIQKNKKLSPCWVYSFRFVIKQNFSHFKRTTETVLCSIA